MGWSWRMRLKLVGRDDEELLEKLTKRAGEADDAVVIMIAVSAATGWTCAGNVTLGAKFQISNVGTPRRDRPVQKSRCAFQIRSQDNEIVRTYHVFPNVLLPLDSASRKNCAALNYRCGNTLAKQHQHPHQPNANPAIAAQIVRLEKEGKVSEDLS